MRRLTWLAVGIAVVALVVGSLQAAAKSYQFTGVVKTVDGNTFTVEKSAKETWTFETAGDTKGAPKVGDKVTVNYKMVATTIEVKPAAPEKKAAPKKK